MYPAIFLVPLASNKSYLFSISATIFLSAILAFLGSVTTGINKCGTPLYILSSTFFGSTKTNLTSSGFALIRIETIILFMHTDLPLPVEPATNKWGVLFISQ